MSPHEVEAAASGTSAECDEPARSTGHDASASESSKSACSRGSSDSGVAAAPGGRKRRRVAIFVSEVDRRLIERGVPPSWEDRVTPEDSWPGAMRDVPDRGDGANDQRLLDNVPPHAQPRA